MTFFFYSDVGICNNLNKRSLQNINSNKKMRHAHLEHDHPYSLTSICPGIRGFFL